MAILSWLISKIQTTLGQDSGRLELAIIKVTYIGSYPCLAARTLDPNDPWEYVVAVERAIAKVIHEESAHSILKYLSETHCNWSEVSGRIMAS